jgi:hypothetical protein
METQGDDSDMPPTGESPATRYRKPTKEELMRFSAMCTEETLRELDALARTHSNDNDPPELVPGVDPDDD